MSLEPFVYLALVLVIALFSLVTRWLKRHMEEQREEVTLGPLPSPWERPSPPPRIVRRARPHERREIRSPDAVSPVDTRRRRHARLRSLRDVRRGIILMTILGPCRGLERPGGPRLEG